MATIVLTDWREGLQKVSLSKLQTELLHLSLREAKLNVDQLLDGTTVVLQVADEVVHEFMKKADELGVSVGIVKLSVGSSAPIRSIGNISASSYTSK